MLLIRVLRPARSATHFTLAAAIAAAVASLKSVSQRLCWDSRGHDRLHYEPPEPSDAVGFHSRTHRSAIGSATRYKRSSWPSSSPRCGTINFKALNGSLFLYPGPKALGSRDTYLAFKSQLVVGPAGAHRCSYQSWRVPGQALCPTR